MFWVATLLLVVSVFGYLVTFVIDPMTTLTMSVQEMNTTIIKHTSEGYVKFLEIKINKPIYYRFVKYRNKKDIILLGTFHEWNNAYYIDISIDFHSPAELIDTIIHETRHMVVQELKNEKIIDLTDYTEEIAREENEIYNGLFDKSIELLHDSEDKK